MSAPPGGGYQPYFYKDGRPAEVRLPQTLAFALAASELGGPALRVALALAVVAYQFADETAAFREIPYAEFERLTRLRPMGVRRGIAELLERQIVEARQGLGRRSSSYRLRSPDEWLTSAQQPNHPRSTHTALVLALTPREDQHSRHVSTSTHTTLVLRTRHKQYKHLVSSTSTSRPTSLRSDADVQPMTLDGDSPITGLTNDDAVNQPTASFAPPSENSPNRPSEQIVVPSAPGSVAPPAFAIGDRVNSGVFGGGTVGRVFGTEVEVRFDHDPHDHGAFDHGRPRRIEAAFLTLLERAEAPA